MTPREIVGARIAEAAMQILTRAMSDTGMCCTRGAPLCEFCSAVVAGLRADIIKVADQIDDAGIARLSTAPPGVIEDVVRGLVEPGFRRHAARNFLS